MPLCVAVHVRGALLLCIPRSMPLERGAENSGRVALAHQDSPSLVGHTRTRPGVFTLLRVS